MGHTIAEIAAALGAEAFGDTSLVIKNAAEPAMAGTDDLALAMSPAYGEALTGGRARAAVVWPGADWQALGLEAAIIVPRARLAMARLTSFLDERSFGGAGIHPSAVVAPDVIVGDDVGIGPFVVIGAGARIGAGSRIGAHVSIAPGAEIGANALILDGVRVRRKVRIGARAILHPNVVIGSDGFSFVSETESNVERARRDLGNAEVVAPQDATWHRIHSLGGVEIGDDVEIGANSTVDAGTIRPTRIGTGTKIDNLVQVGHNVIIGRDCLISAHSAIAGSAVLGDRVVLGGKSGVADNITVGDDVVLTGATIALSNVPARRIMMGYPAVPIATHIAIYKAMRRLPRVLKEAAGGTKLFQKSDKSD
ncbi:MAG TPA: UDP-3-O-(3-hydroxymyristoyl)glucosamine N-acyltransferase [Paracoccaceae bacterium]|nr:UDP-3-O-(3-hydroxymyristoyl)glucosamine N-acyltransferase [Paracoccaceae bacterium]